MIGVVVRAEKMQGDIRPVAEHPAVVSRCDVKDVSRAHFSDGAIVHCSSRAAGDDDSDVLDRATRGANSWADMHRPSPAGLVGRAADRHAADPDNLELAFLEIPNFVGLLEPFQDHIHIFEPSSNFWSSLRGAERRSNLDGLSATARDCFAALAMTIPLSLDCQRSSY